jgi:hypothetical protein
MPAPVLGWMEGGPVLTIFFLFSVSVEAKSPCTDVSALVKRVTSCQQNKAYSLEAAKCVIRLNREVEKSGLGLSKILSSSGTDQEKYFQDQRKNMKKMRADLDRLIASADAGTDAMNLYLMHFAQPLDVNNPHSNGGDPARFAQKFPCYTSTQNVLLGAREVFQDRSLELRLAKKTALLVDESSGLAAERLENMQSLPGAVTGNPTSAPSTIPQKKGLKPSDISGTEPAP